MACDLAVYGRFAVSDRDLPLFTVVCGTYVARRTGRSDCSNAGGRTCRTRACRRWVMSQTTVWIRVTKGVSMRDLWELSRAIWTVNSSGRSGYLPAIRMVVMVMPIAKRNHSSVVARPMKNVAGPFKGRGWVPSAERASRDTLAPEPW
jgi:hypothetical protein